MKKEWLDIKFHCDDLDGEITIRQYLKQLLLTLWAEQEGFSGKRPFGNSGWDFDLYAPLIKAGAIKGVLDSDGYVASFNREEAWNTVNDLIHAAFEVPSDAN